MSHLARGHVVVLLPPQVQILMLCLVREAFWDPQGPGLAPHLNREDAAPGFRPPAPSPQVTGLSEGRRCVDRGCGCRARPGAAAQQGSRRGPWAQLAQSWAGPAAAGAPGSPHSPPWSRSWALTVLSGEPPRPGLQRSTWGQPRSGVRLPGDRPKGFTGKGRGHAGSPEGMRASRPALSFASFPRGIEVVPSLLLPRC